MKYVIVLGDGMADFASKETGKTPLETANKPTMDKLAALGQTGLVQTIPQGMKPGSDVANLSVMGYDPRKYYTGRSPLEALSMGIDLQDDDVAIRCNLVTLSNEPDYAQKTMIDYSAGEISTAESTQLMQAVQEALGNDEFHFYSGVSYRHCLVWHKGSLDTAFTPPHDISDKPIANHLPKGRFGDKLYALMVQSQAVLASHPINIQRVAQGKNPASSIWLWGAGSKPQLDSFKDKYGLDGAVVSAVDLLKGIAKGAGMLSPDVQGATGTLDTNASGKIKASIDCLEGEADFLYLHIEAPDECSHQGDTAGKIKAIELVDNMLKQLWDYLDGRGEPYVLALLPDHETPLCLRTHTSGAVPYAIYKSGKPAMSGLEYNENAAKNGVYLPDGQKIILTMLEK